MSAVTREQAREIVRRQGMRGWWLGAAAAVAVTVVAALTTRDLDARDPGSAALWPWMTVYLVVALACVVPGTRRKRARAVAGAADLSLLTVVREPQDGKPSLRDEQGHRWLPEGGRLGAAGSQVWATPLAAGESYLTLPADGTGRLRYAPRPATPVRGRDDDPPLDGTSATALVRVVGANPNGRVLLGMLTGICCGTVPATLRSLARPHDSLADVLLAAAWIVVLVSALCWGWRWHARRGRAARSVPEAVPATVVEVADDGTHTLVVSDGRTWRARWRRPYAVPGARVWLGRPTQGRGAFVLVPGVVDEVAYAKDGLVPGEVEA
ncbi:hypothetical protein [Arsenicicoccus dermatophilus]|uniref:hypothetical protein n=1 Tax=Arsenicicoccus dermatophilus TaxID=1076331 RepID=UPI001F4C5530|nr:hypothetical protein [Arsenicicoccus dermatophilus]MCH8612705.1 hypothetical protein [Arsenicicoccus dermatophilus]